MADSNVLSLILFGWILYSCPTIRGASCTGTVHDLCSASTEVTLSPCTRLLTDGGAWKTPSYLRQVNEPILALDGRSSPEFPLTFLLPEMKPE